MTSDHHGNGYVSSDEEHISFSYSSDEEFLPDIMKKKKQSSPGKTPRSPGKVPKIKRPKIGDKDIKTLGDVSSDDIDNGQPRQHTPLRRYEDKKSDDLFSLEKKRRRLSSMNSIRRPSLPTSEHISKGKTLDSRKGGGLKPRTTMPSNNETTKKETIWKSDGMLNCSSSDESDHPKKPTHTDIISRMKSIFSESDSDMDSKSVVKKSKPKSVAPIIPKSTKKKQGVYSDSDEDSDHTHRKSLVVKPKRLKDIPSKRCSEIDKDESSSTKKLRLIDIDFTGGKMRPPALSNKKLTPLKKLRLQSQKHHHGPHRTSKQKELQLHKKHSKELFTHKDTVLAAKFPQKRNLTTIEHS